MKKVGKEERSYVKRSVVFHPIVYEYVQKLRSIAMEKGIDLSFSGSVNAMIVYQIISVIENSHKEGLKALWDFIFDKKTIEEINRKDQEEQWKEEMRKKLAKILE